MQVVAFHHLAVMGDIMALQPVKVHLSHVGAVFTQLPGNPVHYRFYGSHGLRPAETAHGRIGRQIGFPHPANDPHVGDKIGVISMQHGPF